MTPTTIRSGRSVSWTAKPSRRNSGFQARPAAAPAGASPAIRAASRAAVPTGTVDLPITRQSRVRYGASPSTTDSMWLRSAPVPPGSCGVPTQMKWASPNSAASCREVLKRSFPEATTRTRISSSPGSKNGAWPSWSAAIFWISLSTPRTSWPSSAMQAACTAPR